MTMTAIGLAEGYNFKDLLRGGRAITDYVWGPETPCRRFYNLAEHSRIPVFKIGAMYYARRSVLEQWIRDQEDESLGRRKKNDKDRPKGDGSSDGDTPGNPDKSKKH